MDGEKRKEGVSIKEMEFFAKKHRFEFFFCFFFILASLFSLVFWGTVLSVFLTAVGGIIGIFIPHQVEHFSKRAVFFVLKQENTTQLIIAIAVLILTIFLAPFVFIIIGTQAGKAFINLTRIHPNE